ncbi:MAG: ABC transporter ATP-binding protein [Patescibacteria group bacterium]|nr:ABC transporter ATP-binding protein [Patescibacteria group bacterium]MBU1876895.1 ABC transporter ATP-binding protein [Patescibacteria group bacterium]
MIKVENIKKIYSREGSVPTIALDGISFDIQKGEFVAIIGPSGSGKSTLMHIMGLLDRPTSGKYFFQGQDVTKLNDEESARIRNKDLGFIFQTFNLLPKTNVFDNVKLPLIYTDLPEQKKNEMVEEAVSLVGLNHRINHSPNQLSGGEQQRVAIARAIINNPFLIFADEPTGNLDSKSGQKIIETLEELNNNGRTIILVTHESYTAQIAKRIISLKDGKIFSDEFTSQRKSAKDGLIR